MLTASITSSEIFKGARKAEFIYKSLFVEHPSLFEMRALEYRA